MASTLKLVIISTPRDNLLRKPFPLDIIEGSTEVCLQEIRIGFPFTCQLQQTVAPQDRELASRRLLPPGTPKRWGASPLRAAGWGYQHCQRPVPRFRHLARIEDVLTVGGERVTRYGVVDQTQRTQRGHLVVERSKGTPCHYPPRKVPKCIESTLCIRVVEDRFEMLDDVLYWCAQFCAQHICFTPCLLGSGVHAAASLPSLHAAFSFPISLKYCFQSSAVFKYLAPSV